jgi:5-methylcytosine-specific restriction protein A
MDLTELLKDRGLDTTGRVKMLRHADKKGLTTYELYKLGHIEEYQRVQGSGSVLGNCDIAVAFVGLKGNFALFVGVWRVAKDHGQRMVKPSPGYPRQSMFDEPLYEYDLVEIPGFEDLQDKLVIDWGPGTRSWAQWLKDKEVVSLEGIDNVPELSGWKPSSGGQSGGKGNHWTKDERRASVEAYLEMLELDRQGEAYVKKEYYRKLSKQFGRKTKAYEYRARNISHVLASRGRAWLPGLAPATNVGTKVIDQIESLIAEAEGKHNTGEAAFEAKVRSAQTRHLKTGQTGQPPPKPKGNSQPMQQSAPTTSYVRDHEVKAWVLNEAAGFCECCRKEAPFIKHDGERFLEVHHVRRLADGGSDCVENAAAVCPNCHRALHYSQDRQAMLDELYESVARLVRE